MAKHREPHPEPMWRRLAKILLVGLGMLLIGFSVGLVIKTQYLP